VGQVDLVGVAGPELLLDGGEGGGVVGGSFTGYPVKLMLP
jgi:hypothetical protein